MATELGTAYVSIVAETSKLEAGLKKAFAAVGKDAGKSISKPITEAAEKAGADAGKKLDESITKATKDTGEKVGKAINESVAKSTTGSGGLAKTAKDAAGEFGKGFIEGVTQGVKSGGGGNLGDVLVNSVSDSVKGAVRNSRIGTTVGGEFTDGLIDGISGALKDSAIGEAITSTLNQVGGEVAAKVTPIINALDPLRDSLKAFKTGDVAGGLQAAVGVLQSLESLGVPPEIAEGLQGIADRAEGVRLAADNISSLATAAQDLGGKDFGKGTKFGDSLDTVAAAAGPVGATVAAADLLDEQLSNLGIAKFTEVPGSALWFLHQLDSDWAGIKQLTDGLGRLGNMLGGPFSSAPVSAQAQLDAARAKAEADRAGGADPTGGLLSGPVGNPSGGVSPSGLNLNTIPLAAQKYANDCINASARIILSHSGINMSEEQLMNVIPPGTNIDNLASGLNQLNPQGNFRAVQGTGANPAAMLSAIQGSINSGTGSILNVAPGSSLAGKTFSDGHFIAVTGYNPDGTINVSDTADGRQYTVSAADAYQATKGRGIVYGTGVGPPPKKKAGGGSVSGSGGPTSDSIPAWLSNGEHVLSASDVSAMGGQSGVYSFRDALHRADGGGVSAKKLEDMRTKGAIPAGAGSTAEAGTSGVAKAIAMGGEFVNGLIDQAANAAATAASAAATAGTMGADGGAGGAAASAAIGLGKDAAKRGVKYGFQMGGIGVDALMQQLTPFGMPRWLTADYTGFVPQQAISGALGDLMSGGAEKAAGGAGGTGGIGSSAKAMPGTGEQPPGPISNLMGSLSPGVDPATIQHGQANGSPPGAAMNNTANSFLSTELQQQEVPAPGQQPMFKVDNIYTTDAHGVGEELSKRGRLAQMQYAGRPMG